LYYIGMLKAEMSEETRTHGVEQGCAKNVLEEHDAVSEMKVGPLKSVCRSRLQTAVSCFSPKGCGGERYGKSRDKSRHVGIRETNKSEPPYKHRNTLE
jgi:hypothetical protein